MMKMKNLIKLWLYFFYSNTIFYSCKILFKINNKKIICSSYTHSYISCNPKYIVKYITENHPKTYDIVWIFKNGDLSDENLTTGMRCVEFGVLKYFYEMATAKIIFSNQRTEFIVGKRKGQMYIQLWHSSAGLKKIEGDAEQHLSRDYLKLAKKDSKKTDLMVSGSRFNTERFRRAFWFNKEILNIGTPRNDILFKSGDRKTREIKGKIGVCESDKIVLYAPTFRNHPYEYSLFNAEKAKDILQKKFGGIWTVLIKFHPNTKIYNKDFTNALCLSKYEDIQELILISDCLITDYSSVMFDYCYTKKPCFLFVPDVLKYYEQERELNFRLEDLPFSVAGSMEQLETTISDFNENEYKININLLLDEIGSYEDGNACKKIMQYIESI